MMPDVKVESSSDGSKAFRALAGSGGLDDPFVDL